MLNTENIPKSLRERRQWVLWRNVTRDGKSTKLPFAWDGSAGSSTDSSKWCDFKEAVAVFNGGRFDGIGFVFTDNDPFCGIDLDGCRDPDTGEIAKWASDIIREVATYSEISPSQTGVKLFAIGSLPVRTGKNQKLPNEIQVTEEKIPGIEMYDHGRYFAVTGMRIDPNRPELEERSLHVKALYERYWPTIQSGIDTRFFAPQSVVERARQYLAKLPPGISGQGRQKATFRAACILVHGFMLEHDQAVLLMSEYNQRCQPPLADKVMEKKIVDAAKYPSKKGYLRHLAPEKWASAEVPDYAPLAHRELTPIHVLAKRRIERMRQGPEPIISTGLPGLDYAIGGGFELGEMVIIAGRPGHGKSAIALQCAYSFTADGLPTLFLSEEMSDRLVGNRMLQFASTIPKDSWFDALDELESHAEDFSQSRANCFVVPSCGTAAAAVAEIERAVDDHGVKVVIVDYAQLLRSPGQGRYEEITNTSMALRAVTKDKGILMIALCQLNREVSKRVLYEPEMHDLKDSGQLEQDADVIVFGIWPYAVYKDQPKQKYRLKIAKNRNRETFEHDVICRFDPARQMLFEADPSTLAGAF